MASAFFIGAALFGGGGEYAYLSIGIITFHGLTFKKWLPFSYFFLGKLAKVLFIEDCTDTLSKQDTKQRWLHTLAAFSGAKSSLHSFLVLR